MGEYSREPGNRIQADFALHAGRLLSHYHDLAAGLDPTKKYDATLVVCVLQALLTNCSELLSSMRNHRRSYFTAPITETPHEWGISSRLISSTFPGAVTLEIVLEHIRDALSHPTGAQDAQPPGTGYTTLEHSSGLVNAFRFVSSPWVKYGRVDARFSCRDIGKVQEGVARFERRWGDDLGLVVCPGPDGKATVCRDGSLYLPVFQIDIPLNTIGLLATRLANFLAQPTNEAWDGVTVTELIA